MKYLSILLATSVLISTSTYSGSTTGVVCLVGGVIKASNEMEDTVKKYKRKDCPVCKGQGWYWSGDMIKKIECQYCEPETKQSSPDSCKTKVQKR